MGLHFCRKAVISSVLLALIAGKVSALPRLLIEVSEGFQNSLVQSTRTLGLQGNFSKLDSQLNNVYTALEPLVDAGYTVDVLLYPTYLYNSSGKQLQERVHPNLRHFLEFFEQRGRIGVFLEVYSSGIMTQQKGPRCWQPDCLPLTPLYTNSSDVYLGLSIDVETVIDLKHAFPRALSGVRFHEVYGCDTVWRGGGGKDCMQLSPHIFEAFIDACADHNMSFYHNDNSWLAEYSMQSSHPWAYHPDSPAYFQAPLLRNQTMSTPVYAAGRLGKQALFSFENNNGFPTADLEYFTSVVDAASADIRSDFQWDWRGSGFTEFPLRQMNLSSGWGISDQAWCWSEFVHTLQNPKQPGDYIAHGEMMSPIEVLVQYAAKAIASHADVLQFEPSWYFFDEFAPLSVDRVMLESLLSPSDPFPPHRERITLRRLKEALISFARTESRQAPQEPQDNAAWPSADLRTVFDFNQTRYLTNSARDPPLNYKQSRLIVIKPASETPDAKASGSSSAFDFYTDARFPNGRQWVRASEPALPSQVVGTGTRYLQRIDLTGDYVDELCMVETAEDRSSTTILFAFAAWGGVTQSQLVIPGLDQGLCEYHSLTAGNFHQALIFGSDPDELLVSRRCEDGSHKLEFYNMSSWSWNGDGGSLGFSFSRMNQALEQALRETFAIDAQGLVIGVDAMRVAAELRPNRLRALDRLAYFMEESHGPLTLEVRGPCTKCMQSNLSVPLSQHDYRINSTGADAITRVWADLDSDTVDELILRNLQTGSFDIIAGFVQLPELLPGAADRLSSLWVAGARLASLRTLIPTVDDDIQAQAVDAVGIIFA